MKRGTDVWSYDSFLRTAELYRALEDDLSKQVFMTQLRYDMEPTPENMAAFSRCYDKTGAQEEAIGIQIDNELERLRGIIADETAQGRKGIIYGTGKKGVDLAKKLLSMECDFLGFCGRNASKYADGLLSRPVVSPEWLMEHRQDCFAILAVTNNNGSYNEIMNFLEANGFPAEHTYSFFSDSDCWGVYRYRLQEYFQHLERVEPGRAMIDSGCFNGDESSYYAECLGDGCSKIYAFEPNPINARHCAERLSKLNAEVVQAALSDTNGTQDMVVDSPFKSYLRRQRTESGPFGRMIPWFSPEDEQKERVQTVRLDDAVSDKVGFIKLQAMGMELDALSGAETIIRRDKPVLSVVIHGTTPGETIAVMDQIYSMVPEYRFLLRKYYDATRRIPGRSILIASMESK